MERKGFYEFFSGGGMARLGLGRGWRCLFSNDFSEEKASAYRLNFGAAPELVVEDVCKIQARQLSPGGILAWASFPCQDLSVAGKGKGLTGERSGTFWPFWNLVNGKKGPKVPIVVLENVVGAITSNQGEDFKAMIHAIVEQGFVVAPLVIDAKKFVPQSRPRLFVVAVEKRYAPALPVSVGPSPAWHSPNLIKAFEDLTAQDRADWAWINLPEPNPRKIHLLDILEEEPIDVSWHTPSETIKILGMMSKRNLDKVDEARRSGKKIVGTIYRRTRLDERGQKVQRAEIRLDGIGGCLRTPSGGSSRQLVIVIESEHVRTRLISSREIARMMGLPDTYKLPTKYNHAYHLLGDGVVPPVVSWLVKYALRPVASSLEKMHQIPEYAQ